MDGVKGTYPLVVTVNGWKDTGKTTIVCALIRHFSTFTDVAAVKICSRFPGSSDAGSDTSRMARAGAASVILLEKAQWNSLGSMPRLAEAFPELSHAGLVICEGLRTEGALGCVVYTGASLKDGIKPGQREARMIMHDGTASAGEFAARTRTEGQLVVFRDNLEALIALVEEELHGT